MIRVVAVAGRCLLGLAFVFSLLGDQVAALPRGPSPAMSVPYSTPDLPVCTVADSDRLISVTNTTSSAITVVGIAADDSMQALADIDAGETVAVKAPSGTDTLGFTQNDDWLGDGYSVTDAIDQAVSVPFAEPTEEATEAQPVDPLLQAMRDYQAGDGSVPVHFTNNTADIVTVVATDENNNGYALFDIDARSSLKQRAQPGTNLWFYKAGTQEVVGGSYTVEISDGEVVSIPVAKAKAAPALSAMQAKQRGEGSVEVMFVNSTSEEVTVVVTDEQQKGHALFDMLPGDFFPMRVLPGAKLYFAKKGTSETVAEPYEVAGVEGEKITIAPPEKGPKLSAMQKLQQGPDSIEAQFTNTLTEPVTVVVIVEEKAHILFAMAAGETSAHRVLPQADLRFINKDTSVELGAPYVVTGIEGEAIAIEPAKAAVDPAIAAMREKHSGPGSVDIEFTNTLNAEIAVTVEDETGTAIPLFTIPTGQIVTQKALPGTELWFFNTETKKAVPPTYKVTDALSQAANIPNRPTLEQVRQEQAGPGSVQLSFQNEADFGIQGVIADSAGLQVRLFEVAPGSTAQERLQPKTLVWFVKAGTDEIVPENFVVPETAPTESVRLPYVPLGALAAAEAGPGSVPVTFENNSSDEVAVTKLVTGQQQTLFYVKPNQRVTHRLQPKAQIWFYKGKTEESSGRDLPYFVQSLPNETVRLPYDPTEAELIAMNGVNIDKIIAEFTKANLDAKTEGPQFCWKDSYGRGVGTVPRSCPPGMSEDTAGLCNTDCQPGYHPFVTMCVPDCPEGFRDDGLFCAKPAPHERAAFIWQVGDKPLSLDDALARCAESDQGKEYGCGTYNLDTIVYSHCPDGYQTAPIATNLCTPVCPAGMIDIGVSCQKITYDRGVGQLMSCAEGKQYDAGLCYDTCKEGFGGVGPVCWNQCPASLPYGCGAGCAVDKSTCDWAIADQATSPLIAVGSIALTVLTAGGSTGATAGAKAGAAAAKTGASIAAKAVAKEGARAAIKAAVKVALQKMVKAGALTLAKEVAIDMAIGTSISMAIYGGTAIATDVGFVKMREELKKIVRSRMIADVSDERIDAIVAVMMEGAEQKGGADVEFPWSSLDPTGIADIVIAYNHPICTDVKQ